MIPPHLFYQIYLSFLEQNYCTSPKYGELSEYTDTTNIEVEDLSSRYMNGSTVYARCGHDTRQFHPSCTTSTPISQDWLHRMKLVRDRSIPLILPSGKNILADTMFKIIIETLMDRLVRQHPHLSTANQLELEIGFNVHIQSKLS